MKTNYQMITELNKVYTPAQRGVVSMKEIYLINEKLHLDEMDNLQLRNLRDFAVMYFTLNNIGDQYDRVLDDKMSAITSVIDNKLWNMGAEV